MIINEYSMVGLRLLARINNGFKEATGRRQEPFCGISVSLVSDILQLPPVLDTPMYSQPNHKEKNKFIIDGHALFSLFEVVVQLTINQRQNDPSQAVFREFLDNLRRGAQNPFHAYHLLRTRMEVSFARPTVKEFKQNGVSLNSINSKVNKDNQLALSEL